MGLFIIAAMATRNIFASSVRISSSVDLWIWTYAAQNARFNNYKFYVKTLSFRAADNNIGLRKRKNKTVYAYV